MGYQHAAVLNCWHVSFWKTGQIRQISTSRTSLLWCEHNLENTKPAAAPAELASWLMKLLLFKDLTHQRLPVSGKGEAWKPTIKTLLLFCVTVAMLLSTTGIASATGGSNETPQNSRKRQYSYKSMAYHWQLVRWETGRKVCDIYSISSQNPEFRTGAAKESAILTQIPPLPVHFHFLTACCSPP